MLETTVQKVTQFIRKSQLEISQIKTSLLRKAKTEYPEVKLNTLGRREVALSQTEETKDKNNITEERKNIRKNRNAGIFRINRSIRYYSNLYDLYSKLLLEDDVTIAEIINNYEWYADKMNNVKSILTPADVEKIDKLSYIIKIFPSIVLLIAKSVKQFELPDKIMKEIDSEKLWKPIGPTDKDFGWHEEISQCVHPKYRYIVNDSGKRVKRILNEEKGTTKVTKAFLSNTRMFFNLADQARWGNIWLQIISMIFTKSQTDIESVYMNHSTSHVSMLKRTDFTYGVELKPIQVVMYILKRYDTLPYYISDTGKITISDNLEEDLPLSMPLVLASMLELSAQQFGYNIMGDELYGAISLRIISSYESFGTAMLNVKSKFTDMVKLLTNAAVEHARYTYFDQQCKGFKIQHIKGFSEVWVDEEEEKRLQQTLANLDVGFRAFMNKSISLVRTGSHTERTEHLRYSIMVIQIYGNPGVYYKTSLLLEAEASIAPQMNTVLDLPTCMEYVQDGGVLSPFKFDWDNSSAAMRNLRDKYVEGLEIVRDDIAGANFMTFFVQLLTNNSQGIKVSLEELGISESEISQNRAAGNTNPVIMLFDRLANARLVSFLLSSEVFTVWERFLDELNKNGMCTIRYQNNRRARIVEIVPNVEQTAYSPLLFVFERLKKHWDEIAVGKQRGGITDMRDQLYASGNIKITNNASDVASMDASTQPAIYKLFSQIFIEWLHKNKIQQGQYFAANKTNVAVHGKSGEYIRTDEISGLIRTMLMITNTKNSGKNFLLRDTYFAPYLEIMNTFFASGQFNTTGQHTTLLSIIGKCIKEDFQKLHPGVPFDLKSKAFGDDSMRSIMFNLPREEEYKYIQELVEMEKKYLKSFGFRTEIFISQAYTDFLQQAAVCGVHVPKSARASLFCDERGETKSRDPIAAIKIMRNVLQNASQRFYCIENIQSMINGIWLCMKTLYLRAGDPAVFKHSAAWKKLTYDYLGKALLILPWVVIYAPPINSANPTLIDYDSGLMLKKREWTSIMGDIGWIWLINGVLSKDDWTTLMDISTEPNVLEGTSYTVIGRSYVTRPASLIVKSPLWLKFNFNVAVQVLDYSRAATLSKTREEQVGAEISKLALKADVYRSQAKLQTSKAASLVLKNDFNFTVPDRITYFGQSETRIKQAITAVDETSNELPMIDEDIAEFMLKISGKYRKNVQASMDRFAIWYSFQEERPFLFSHAIQQEYSLPILPGYRTGSEYGELIKYTGTALGSEGRITKTNFFSSTSKKNQKFDYEAAIRAAQQARARGREVESLFWLTLSLTPDEQAEFEDLLNNLAGTITTFEYSSQFSPNGYFLVSGLSINFENNWSTDDTQLLRARNLLTSITRDVYFMHPLTSLGGTLNLQPSAYTKKYHLYPLRTRINGHTYQTTIKYS